MNGRVKFWFMAAALGTLPLIALAFLSRPVAAAGLWYVTPGGSDANDCQTTVTPCATINGAIGKAAPGDTIDVATGTYTAATGNQVVWITQNVTLLGGWDSSFTNQAGLSTVDGQSLRRGLTVTGTQEALVDGFVIQNGRSDEGGGVYNSAALTLAHTQVVSNAVGATFAVYGSGSGGGVFNTGSLTVTSSVIESNTSQEYAGGLWNAGQATIISSSVSANEAFVNPSYYSGFGGGGIQNDGNLVLIDSTVSGNSLHYPQSGAGIATSGPLTVTNSTISGNSGGDGVGIFVQLGALWLYNATISFNSGAGVEGSVPFESVQLQNSLLAGNGGPDCAGPLTSLGYNIVGNNSGCNLAATDITGTVAHLGTLQDNGGPAPTVALLPGSPAINGGNPGGCFGPDGLLASDERGYPRLGPCDIGAFEAQPFEASNKTVNLTSAVPGQTLRYTVSLTNSGAGTISSVVVTDTLPAGLNYTNGSLTATGGTFKYTSGVITWTGALTAGGLVTIQFEASTQPNANMGTLITNTALISGNGETFPRQAETTLAPARLYLPLVFKPQPGIQGYVTLNGAPAAGVFLELRHFDGHFFSTVLSTNTDANGFYNFTSAPSLPPGQFYYVRYLNIGGTPGFLWFWGTANITSFTAGNSVGAGTFDLADVPLVSPPDHATVALPAPFQWVRRTATQTDSYQLTLFDPNNVNTFGQTGLLGYVNGVTLTGVPSSFHSGTPYLWEVNINSPDGGFGTSYEARWVTFNNILAGSQPAVIGGAELSAATPPVDRPRP